MAKIVGVEITSNEIRAVVAKSGKPVSVQNLYTYSIPPSLVADGNVIDSDILANEVSKMWKKYKLPRKNINVAISNRKITVRSRTFSNIDKNNIKNLLKFLVSEDDIPVAVDKVNMDFYITAEKPNKLEGLLVSIPSVIIKPIVETFRKEKISIKEINLAPLALINSLIAGKYTGRIALIDMERDWVSITLVDNGVPISIRFIPSKLARLIREIEELMDTDMNGVLEIFENVGIADVVETEKEKEIVLLIHKALKDIYRSISETLRYFNIDSDRDEYDLVVLTGIGSLIKNIDLAFSQSLSTDVVFGDPFINVKNVKIEETKLNKVLSAVPIGLILGSSNG